MADGQGQSAGRQKLNRGMVELAGQVPGYALNRLAGMGPLQAGVATLGSLLTEKVIGPTAALTGIFFGILKTVTALARQTDAVGRGIERMGRVERVESAFTTLTRSAARAREEVKRLMDFTLRTGKVFGFEGVAEAARTLEVLTKGAYAGAAALKQVGDVAAATNSSIEDTAFWIGKLYNFMQNDRPVANLLFRLQDVGIVSGELANELERLEGQGAGFAQKWAAVQKELERAKGGMDDEAKSLFGLRQQLVNAAEAMERAFGGKFVEQEKSGIQATLRLYEAFTPVMQEMAAQAGQVTGLWRRMADSVKGGVADFEQQTGAGVRLVQVLSGVAKALAVVAAVRIAGAAGGLVGALTRSNGVRGASAAFARGSLTAAGAVDARSRFVESARASISAGKRAKEAFAQGAIGTAAALGTEMALAKASAIAFRNKAIAMEAAAASGGKLSLATAGVATGLRGLLGLAGRLGGGLLKGVFAIGPWGLAATGITLVVQKLWEDRQAAKAAEDANQQLSEAIEATNRAMREQIAHVKTLADYNGALAKASGNVLSAQEAIASFQAGDKGEGDKKRLGLLTKALAEAKTDRDRLLQLRQAGGLLESPETAGLRAGERLERRELAEQAAFDAADDQGKLAILRSRQARVGAEAAQGEFLRSAEMNAADRGPREALSAQEAEIRAELARIGQLQAGGEEGKAARAALEARMRSGGLSEAEQGRLGELRGRRGQIMAAATSLPGATLEEQRKGSAARAELLELGKLEGRARGARTPSGAELDSQVQAELARRITLEAELGKVIARRTELERSSEDPIVRLNAEMEALSKAIAQAGASANPEQRASLSQKQAELADLQLRKDRTGEAAAEAIRLRTIDIPRQQTAARDEAVRRQLSAIDLRSERDIYENRSKGVKAERERLEIEERAAQQQAAVLERRLQSVGISPEERQQAQEQLGGVQNRLAGIQQQRWEGNERAKDFARDFTSNLRAAELEAAGNRKGAQAERDRSGVVSRAREIMEATGTGAKEAMGLAMREAQANITAGALAQGPRIIADSLQSVGGGGGAAAFDPLVKAQERTNALLANQNTLLGQLVQQTRPSIMD